jgi:hypothetical protein
MKTCAACGELIKVGEPYRRFVWAGFLAPGGVVPDSPDLFIHERHAVDWTPPDPNYQDVTEP